MILSFLPFLLPKDYFNLLQVSNNIGSLSNAVQDEQKRLYSKMMFQTDSYRYISCLPDGTYHGKSEDRNGNLEGEYKNGRKEGKWKRYFLNGTVSEEGKYCNGIREGEWRFYHHDGSLKSEGSYVCGKKEGDWANYHPNGDPWIRGNFRNGKRHGPWLYLSPQEERTEGIYRDDRKFGRWVFYRHHRVILQRDYSPIDDEDK